MAGRAFHSLNEPSEPPHEASDLARVLASRAPRLALTLAAGQAAWPVVKWVKGKVKESRTFTVKVPGGRGDDELYDELHEWVLTLMPPSQQHALVAYSAQEKRPSRFLNESMEHRHRAEMVKLRLRYDGSREQEVMVRGHRVKLCVSDSSGASSKDKAWQPPAVVFTTLSQTARDAVVGEISSVLEASQRKKRLPVFRMLDNWDEWARVDDLPSRPLESVILPAGQLERLTADLATFLASEEAYNRRSVPWHRGHLYQGAPGTGKTSVARALACHFGFDMWYLSLAGVKNDTSLIKTILAIKGRSVLLLEDIDVFHAATQRGDEYGGTTLSGLLNALDGIATPHGLITILTTNKPEALDPALIRPGRIDLIEDFSFAGLDEMTRFIAYWYDIGLDEVKLLLPDDFRLAPAEVTQICSRHDDPGDAASMISRLSENPEASQL